MRAVPIELKDANAFVEKLHRHHAPVHRDKFRFAVEDNGCIHGVCQCGRPISRYLDDGKTIEVVRLCMDIQTLVVSFIPGRHVLRRNLGMKK